jgi:deferrochelatase/peroxidase EfeB
MLLGRFRDGTPLVLAAHSGGAAGPPNDFDYTPDPSGAKCPFHAHTRKLNPRGDGGDLALERSRMLARRGMPYGVRSDDPADPTTPLEQLPSSGVGLLFMAFQRSVEAQFEHIQSRWANEPGFAHLDTGVDPVVGMGGSGGHFFRTRWGADTPWCKFDFRGYVRPRGGEYFFAPSRSFLRALSQ